MIVNCACGAKLKISDEKLTDAGVRIKCPKCGTAHLVKKPATAAPSPAPAMPWFAPSAEPAAQPASAQMDAAPAAAPSAAPAMPWFASAPAGEQAVPPKQAPQPAPAKAPSAPVPSSAEPAMPWFAAKQEEPRQAAAPGRTLVLVAHDSTVVVDMIRGVVTGAGFKVDHAPDGLDALRKASALKPQVMIVDVGLTGIYGFELCERLKSDPDTRGIKIILLSSVYGLTAYKRNPVTLYGADDYIEKHHIPDKLVDKIRDLLAGRKPAAAAPAPPAPPEPKAEAAARMPEPAVTRTQERTPQAASSDDVLPKVPVTLDGTRRLTASPVTASMSAPRPVPAAASAPEATAPRPAPPPPAASRANEQDASIKLDAAFFEQDEYRAPAKAPARAAGDPEEIEKARRFARLVVSDIVLYNQEAVAEGVAKGTFYELLKDDITEGRALYDKRVPEAIRMGKDYYQEAFDNFIASKKKQR